MPLSSCMAAFWRWLYRYGRDSMFPLIRFHGVDPSKLDDIANRKLENQRLASISDCHTVLSMFVCLLQLILETSNEAFRREHL